MLNRLGKRQQHLLHLLLRRRDGLKVDGLAQRLGISRNAVYQHLSALEDRGLVRRHKAAATGGRPGQTFVLTEEGVHLFPKHYDWFASLVMKTLVDRLGEEQATAALEDLGAELADGLKARLPYGSLDERIAAVAGLMAELGYEARVTPTSRAGDGADDGAAPEIEAFNCIYHNLAQEHPEVCRLDIALLRRLLGVEVDHASCMLRGSDACRFRVVSKDHGEGEHSAGPEIGAERDQGRREES